MKNYIILLIFIFGIGACTTQDDINNLMSLDELPSLPKDISKNLKKSKTTNNYIAFPNLDINKPIKIPHEVPACICTKKAFVYVTYPITICTPLNAPEDLKIKQFGLLPKNSYSKGIQEYKHVDQNKSIFNPIYCFTSSGPWSATIFRTFDGCAQQVSFQLIFPEGIVGWNNTLADMPAGIDIVGGSSAVDFDPKTEHCSNCAGSISDCDGDGVFENPADIDDGI